MEKASVPKGMQIGNINVKGENISIGENRADERRHTEADWKPCRRKNLCRGNTHKGMGYDGGPPTHLLQ